LVYNYTFTEVITELKQVGLFGPLGMWMIVC